MVSSANITTTKMVLMVPFVAPEYGEIPGAMTQRRPPGRLCPEGCPDTDQRGKRILRAWRAAGIGARNCVVRRYYLRRQSPIVGVVPHFDPSGAPPLGQNTDTNASLASQLTGPSA